MSNQSEQIVDNIFGPIAMVVESTAATVHAAFVDALDKAKEEGRQAGLQEAIKVAGAQGLLFYENVSTAQEGMQERIIEFIGLYARGEL